MIENHPITPPPELVQRWTHNAYLSQPNMGGICHEVATQAARWGADQELEACCKYINGPGKWFVNPKSRLAELHAARRPKPPSLAEQALETLKYPKDLWDEAEVDTIRRALERLQELEQSND